MKSRIAMLALLVFGVMLSGTGAGLAIQGSTGNGNAAQEQYPTDTPAGGVLGEQEDQDGAGERGNGDAVAGAEDTAAPQVERQVAAGTSSGAAGGELPFTGFAAIPILLLGLAMTVAGVVLRRRSAGEDA